MNPPVDRGFELKGKLAEEFVHNLAEKSFLEDWCYKNPKLPDGNELCDLLVVYDDIAIIWQVKDLKLDEKGKYNQSEVEKNIRQLSGARRTLFDLKIPIELENPRRGKEAFNPAVIKETYLISALLGEPQDQFTFAETVNGRTIHVFTREFTELVLRELDTIRDFISYLKEKERLFSDSSITMMILGEEKELLAHYLMNGRSFDKLRKFHEIVIDEGCWDEFIKKPEYRAKKQADEISYGWDDIINRVHTGGRNYEKMARELARTNRFERRFLAKSFLEAHVAAHETEKDTFRRVVQANGTTYCFMFLDDPEPRERRKYLLGIFCFVARGVFKQQKVIGIATEKKIRPECSYDFCFLEIPEWTDDMQKNMEKIQSETNILVKPEVKRVHEDEYPSK